MTYTKVTLEWPIYEAFPDGSETETIYEVVCGLTPEDPGCHTLPGGDPGYPGGPAECEILSVTTGGKEVEDWRKLICKDMQDAIEQAAFSKANDDAEGAAEDHADAERERRLERD